jgi:hypothetical protein
MHSIQKHPLELLRSVVTVTESAVSEQWQTMEDNGPLHIFCVYLPQADCIAVDFSTVLQGLNGVIKVCLILGPVMVIGDVSSNVGTADGERGWCTTNHNVKLIMHFIDKIICCM